MMAAPQVEPFACTVAVVEAIVQIARVVPVFPCRRNSEMVVVNGVEKIRKSKSPLTPHGFQNASSDPEQIRAWWRRWPEALVGVPTGHGTRIIVVDYDPDKVTQDTDDWIAEHSDSLMASMSHKTTRGGRHYLFTCPKDVRYRSGTSVTLEGKVRPGLDVRAEGGYVIWWPLHGGSRTGNIIPLPSGLIDDLRVETKNIAPLPTRLPEKWLADKAMVCDALAYIDPSDYNKWIIHGAILHYASNGSEDGFTVWHSWSSGDLTGETPLSYGGIDACREKWQTFSISRDRTKTATLGSLFKTAKDAGYVPRTGHDPFTAQSVTAVDAPIEDDGFDWPAPADFLKKVTPPRFTADDVPSCLSRYATEWAAATGFDLNGVVVACVSAASAALSDGLRLLVNPSSSYYESARLWTVLIGPPGVAKTPCIGAATHPIKTMHREMFDEWQKDAAKARAQAKIRDEDPEVPPRPALYTSDATIEALAEILVGNPRGIFFLSEEFESWLGSHDAYRGGGGSKDRGEWLRAYDGGPHQVDRVKRGSFYVPNWGIGILSATTPGALQKMAKYLPVDGLMQRFIPVIISPGGEPHPDADVAVAEQGYHNTLHRLLEYGPGTGVRVVSLSQEGAEALRAEMSRLRKLALDVDIYGEAFAGHIAKHSGMLARLTLTFHALGLTDGRHPGDVPVQAVTVALAARFMRKVFRHSLAVYSDLLGNDSAIELARAVGRFLLAGGYRQITRRDLSQNCKAFRKAENERLREEAMQFLVDMAWIRELDGQYAKGHATHWGVNPQALSVFQAYGEEHKERRRRVLEAIQEGR